MLLTPADYLFICDDDALREAAIAWQNSDYIALDTEFIRTNTFYPIPGLIQVYDGEHCYLIDPTRLNDYAPMTEVLNNDQVVKILHSCSEDLEVFDDLLHTVPDNLFDTQVAAAFLGHRFSIGYSALVNDILGIDLPKEESRSDWLQRPLTDKQLTYACLDVIHLYEVFEHLTAHSSYADKQEWIEQCNRELINNYRKTQDPEQYFFRIKNGWRLNPSQQIKLQELSLWREQEARRRNKPRNHIVRDNALWGIAAKQPANKQDLQTIEDLSPNTIKRYGETLIDLLDQPLHREPEFLLPKPLPKEIGILVKKLKAFANNKAEQLNIATEMLIRKKDYENFVRSGMQSGNYDLPDNLKGWREPLIGEAFLDIARQWHA